MEEWKDIEGFEGYYQVSNLGNIKSLVRRHGTKSGQVREVRRELILSPTANSRGYKVVQMMMGAGKYKSFSVHYLVAYHFIGKAPMEKGTVNHIDGNKANNSVINLEWLSIKDNIHHGQQIGLIRKAKQPGYVRTSGSATRTGRKPINYNSERSQEILSLKGKMSKDRIAKKYNCSWHTVKKIWEHSVL